MSQQPANQCQRSVIHLLRRVDQCAAQLYSTESADSDLTLRQLAILTAISRQEDLSQTDLVNITGIDRSTVAGIAESSIHWNIGGPSDFAIDLRSSAPIIRA